jgi:hypothetical protein
MSGNEIFGHIKKTHEDLSKPAKRLKVSNNLAWAYKADNFNPDVNHKDAEEFDQVANDTLAILDKEDRFLLSVDNTLATAFGDVFALNFNEHLAHTSIAIKGQGRKDAKEVTGGVKQSISMPTSLQKMRRVLTGRGGKVEEEEETTIGTGDGER